MTGWAIDRPPVREGRLRRGAQSSWLRGKPAVCVLVAVGKPQALMRHADPDLHAVTAKGGRAGGRG